MHRFALASRTGSFEAQEGAKEAEPPPGAHAPRHALGARTAEGLGFNGGQQKWRIPSGEWCLMVVNGV